VIGIANIQELPAGAFIAMAHLNQAQPLTPLRAEGCMWRILSPTSTSTISSPNTGYLAICELGPSTTPRIGISMEKILGVWGKFALMASMGCTNIHRPRGMVPDDGRHPHQ
jgi:hypothetical protein